MMTIIITIVIIYTIIIIYYLVFMALDSRHKDSNALPSIVQL